MQCEIETHETPSHFDHFPKRFPTCDKQRSSQKCWSYGRAQNCKHFFSDLATSFYSQVQGIPHFLTLQIMAYLELKHATTQSITFLAPPDVSAQY